ncbi:MAG TPA: ATP-binding protein, partial [Actinomycetota bacterium]|nr:ATP-binding protein [Actinomycetota bacterium]
LSWNPAMEEITGSRMASVVGRPWQDVLGVPWPVDGSARGRTRRDVRITGKNGALRWLRVAIAPILDEAGEVKAHAVAAHDVTGELEAQRLRTDLFATVAHELQIPLSPLKGYLVALRHGTIDDSTQSRAEYYRIMLNQANRLERLIADLWKFAKMGSATPDLDRQVLELTGLVAEQIHDVSQPYLGRQVVFRGPGDPVFVEGDPFRVEQVLANLLTNAIECSPPSSQVEVRVTRLEREAVVSVLDSGEEIPAAQRDRVFERPDRPGADAPEPGLGLYISKRLVEAMGGRIWVVSVAGQGSTFSFSLPLAMTAGDEGVGGPPGTPSLAGRRS